MSRRNQELNYWPAVADVFLAAFLLSLFFWYTHTLLSTVKLDQAEGDKGTMIAENDYLKKQLADAEREIKRLNERLAELTAELSRVSGDLTKLQDALKDHGDIAQKYLALLEEITKLKSRLIELEIENKKLANASNQVQSALAQNEVLKEENARMKQKLAGIIHDKPPNIDLTDRANFKFESGSAEFTSAFIAAFDSSPDLKRLPEIVRDYKVDVIEVIGHTDAEWNLSHAVVSNLDRHLGKALTASPGDISTLQKIRFGSNADLGLMRAIAVRQLIRKRLEDANLPGIQVRCYSAAQSVIPSGDSVSASDYLKPDLPEAERRRIEIRFTRLPK